MSLNSNHEFGGSVVAEQDDRACSFDGEASAFFNCASNKKQSVVKGSGIPNDALSPIVAKDIQADCTGQPGFCPPIRVDFSGQHVQRFILICRDVAERIPEFIFQ